MCGPWSREGGTSTICCKEGWCRRKRGQLWLPNSRLNRGLNVSLGLKLFESDMTGAGRLTEGGNHAGRNNI